MSIAVLMPVFKPRPEYLYEQIASIASQKGVITKLFFVIADLESKKIVVEIATQLRIDYEILLPIDRLDVTEAIIFGINALLCSHSFSYLAICDQDDIWMPEKLKFQLEFLASTRAELTFSDAIVINHDNTEQIGTMHKIERRPIDPHLRNLATGNIGTGMTFFMTFDFASLVIPYIRPMRSDMLHDFQIMIIGSILDKVKFDQRCLVRYRQHSGNHTGIFSIKKVMHKLFGAHQDKSSDQGKVRRDTKNWKYCRAKLVAGGVIKRVNILKNFIKKYLEKQLSRYIYISEMERLIAQEFQDSCKPSTYSNISRFFFLMLLSLYKRRFVRALNALIIIWFIFRNPAGQAS